MKKLQQWRSRPEVRLSPVLSRFKAGKLSKQVKMFSGYQEREEYEDELYAEEEHADVSETDSDLEFQLYSQLHYCTENPEENQASSGHETPQEPQPDRRVQPPAAPPDEVILIDSGPDVITLSDNTEEEDSVCARKGQRSKGKGAAAISQPQHLGESEAVRDEVVVLDSESDQSSDSELIPPYVVDPDLDSDSDGLESWMILGREKEEGDQDIQLNVLAVRNREHSVKEAWSLCFSPSKGGVASVLQSQ
ncbi:hypothetical protein QTP86_012183 [Hemibagrus guttatus]|nr:hypothetical protein QTP86_012183 [Hemibagrus guttatus]